MEPFYVRPNRWSNLILIVLHILLTIFLINIFFGDYYNFTDTSLIFLLMPLGILISLSKLFFQKYKSKTYYIAEHKISIINNSKYRTGIQLEFKNLINYQITGESNEDEKEVLYLYFNDFQLAVDNSIYTNYEKLKGYILANIPEDRRISRVVKSAFSIKELLILIILIIIAFFFLFKEDNLFSYSIKGMDKGKSFVLKSVLTETPIIAEEEDGTSIKFLTDTTKDYLVEIVVKTKDENDISFIKEFWVAGDTVEFRIHEYPYKYFILGEEMSSIQKKFIEEKLQATSIKVDNLELLGY